MIDKGIPRTGYKVMNGGGRMQALLLLEPNHPTLKKNVGMALVDIKNAAEIGTELFVQVRNRLLKAKVVATPFYKRENKGD